MNIDEFEECEQLNVNKQRLYKRKNTEGYVCTILTTQLKHSKKEIVKNDNQYFMSNEELWINSLTELKDFINLNERRPNKRNETEKVLGLWLCTQQNNRKTEKYDMLNEDIKNLWDSFIKDYNQYFLSNEELWTNNLTELKKFIDLNERRPLRSRETEKELCIWLINQCTRRKTENQIMLNKDIRNTWDSFIKDYNQYFLSNEELWTNNFTKLKKFIDLNERRPSRSKETEKVLCMWLHTQLTNRKIKKDIMSNQDIINTWDIFIKDNEQYFISNEELWTNNLTELKQFIDLNDRRPSKKKKNKY